MATEVSFLLAFAAGLLSFLSPCVLPLIPSYLSFMSGVAFRDLDQPGEVRRRLVGRTALFVLGFSIVFVALGLLFSGPAMLFSGASRWINFVSGLLVILLGLNVMFDFVAGLNVERRVQTRTRPAGAVGTVLVGMAFGAGWSPCIGPILASILLLAGSGGAAGRAAGLLAVYSAGLGLPFMLAGLAFGRFSRSMQRLKPYLGAIRTASGAFLIGLGLLIMFGRFQQLNGWLMQTGLSLERWAEANTGQARLVTGAVPVLLGLLIPLRSLLGERRLPRRPLPVIMTIMLCGLGVLTLSGAVDMPGLLSEWLRYQGI